MDLKNKVDTIYIYIYSFARLYRYFKPKGGKVKCSPEAMKMWKTKDGSPLVVILSWLRSCDLVGFWGPYLTFGNCTSSN